MTASILTDEHVPSVFVTALRSNGHDVCRATDAFGEATDDERLLTYGGEMGRVLVTHDNSDFGGTLGPAIDHAGNVIDTDPTYLRDDPDAAVRTLERILEQYPPDELETERAWLDQWRP